MSSKKYKTDAIVCEHCVGDKKKTANILKIRDHQ